jgi:aromatic ring-opening dioxygenase LigB subunit
MNADSKVHSAVLMCHAPIVIPEIGAERATECADSTRTMAELADVLMSDGPDVLIVLSPHTPRLSHSFSWVDGPMLTGSFERFGFPELHAEFPNARSVAQSLERQCREEGVALEGTSSFSLDHGAMVPLEFMKRAGWSGDTLVIGFPYRPSHVDCRRLGRAIAQGAQASGQKWALLASGDMSHRLIPNAPAGFHPDAQSFDDHMVTSLTARDLNEAVLVDEDLRALAAEDVVDSLEIASAAINFDGSEVDLLSYEGPFGVGYMNAVLRRV